MNNDYQSMIDESEESIHRINSRIRKINDALPSLSGKDVEMAYTKIKIYESMIDDLIYAQSQMREYLSLSRER